jgi:hypothetical protein
MIPIEDGVVTTGFMVKGTAWSKGWHTGVDIPAPKGTRVLAARNGVVVKAGPGVLGAALGIAVVVKGEDGTHDRYCHLDSHAVHTGLKVTLTSKIGTVGTTGTNSTGPHLHFERGATSGWAGWQDPRPSLAWAPKPVALTVIERWGARPGVKKLVFRTGPGPNFPVVTTKPSTWEGRMTHRTPDGKWVATTSMNWIDKSLVERKPS